MQIYWQAAMKKITSPDNPTFRQLRTLAGSSRERRRLNRTVLDGLHLLQAYVARVGPPELVALSDSAANSGEIAGFLAGQPGMRLVVLSDALFGKVGLVSTPTGVLSLIGIPAARPVRRPANSSLSEVTDFCMRDFSSSMENAWAMEYS